jgi:hypothetical protein
MLTNSREVMTNDTKFAINRGSLSFILFSPRQTVVNVASVEQMVLG